MTGGNQPTILVVRPGERDTQSGDQVCLKGTTHLLHIDTLSSLLV